MAKKSSAAKVAGKKLGNWKNVLVEFEDGIAWVTLNRPEKRNAMNPTLNDEMLEVLDALELEHSRRVLVLTGAGDVVLGRHGPAGSTSARPTRCPTCEQLHARRSAWQWQWQLLMYYSEADHRDGQRLVLRRRLHAAGRLRSRDRRRGGARSGCPRSTGASFRPASSPRRWPQIMSQRDALLLRHDRRAPSTAARPPQMGLVNEAVPLKKLRAHTKALAHELMGKNPTVLRAAKTADRHVRDMSWDDADDYLMAKNEQARFLDPEGGREQGPDAVPRREELPARARRLPAR